MERNYEEDCLRGIEWASHFSGRSPNQLKERDVPNGMVPQPAFRFGDHPNARWYWWKSDWVKWATEMERKYPYIPPSKPANDNDPEASNDNTPAEDIDDVSRE